MSSINSLPLASTRFTRSISTLFFVFCAANVVTGPLRWALAMIKLTPVIYFPVLGLLIGLAWSLWHNWQANGLSRLQSVALLTIAYGIFMGLMYVPVVQVGFGVYVLLPFFFGLAAAPIILENPERTKKFILILWVIACVGVLLNMAVTYPWEGFEYEVAGQNVEGSREWENTGGGKRIAGFSRSSFDGAIQIQLLAIALIMLRTGIWGNVLIWIVSAIAIFATTSKGIYNVYLVLTPIVLLKDNLSERWVRLWPLCFGLIALWLPISTLFVDYNFRINDPFWANLTFSFYDRLNNMWPEAWHLMQDFGHPIFGRGFGGLGTAQSYFEPARFNAGDNLFMYWFVIFGWFALPIILCLLAATCWLKPWSRAEDKLPYALTLATIVYGLTTNVVENAYFAATCGMVIHYLAVRMREQMSAT